MKALPRQKNNMIDSPTMRVMGLSDFSRRAFIPVALTGYGTGLAKYIVVEWSTRIPSGGWPTQICGLFRARLLEGELDGISLLSNLTWISKKNLWAALCVKTRKLPPIVLELGYGESDDELLNGTDLLLEGSKGRIGYAIVVKIETLAPGEREIQDGYVELHKYSRDTGKRVKIGSRMVNFHYYFWPLDVPLTCSQRLYPPPANRSQQCIEFSWAEILRNKKSEVCITQEKPPPLYLDDLRTELEEGVEFYFNIENALLIYLWAEVGQDHSCNICSWSLTN